MGYYFSTIWHNEVDMRIIYLGILLVVFENLAFVTAVLWNPGLAKRDPSIHSKRYLKVVRDVERASGFKKRICRTCMVIWEEKAKVEHCNLCGWCMRDMDHHCPWTSKCIAGGNVLPFRAFISLLMLVIVYLSLSMALVFDE
jgi:hypothetical protein